jgi:broad specificity phosphatase PhoE
MDLDHGPIQIEATRYIPGQVPDENSKIVHFQRHGQGYHNLMYSVLSDAGAPVLDVYDPDPLQNPFVRPEMVDAPLTELGRQQCAEQRLLASQLKPQVLIVSPLHRAIQTAQITFADFCGKIPFIAHEWCREEMGLLVCNKRRPLSETIQDYPRIDFSIMKEMGDDQDTLWNPNYRECPKAQSQRIYKFLSEFLRHRPEQELAVVGHSAWLFNMGHTVLQCDDELKKWFGTSEIRSMQLKFTEKR